MNDEQRKKRDDLVAWFTSKWEYQYDKEQFGASDAWKIIYNANEKGKFVGDCEDYSLSILYRLCGENKLKMWWMLLTHQAGICLVGPNKWKVSHAVLRYKGEYVDNWTRKFGPKSVCCKVLGKDRKVQMEICRPRHCRPPEGNY